MFSNNTMNCQESSSCDDALQDFCNKVVTGGKKSFMELAKSQILTLIIAALAFVTALLWNSAIQEWLKPLYENAEGAWGLTLAAIILTVIAIIIGIILTSFLG